MPLAPFSGAMCMELFTPPSGKIRGCACCACSVQFCVHLNVVLQWPREGCLGLAVSGVPHQRPEGTKGVSTGRIVDVIQRVLNRRKLGFCRFTVRL